MDVNRYYARRKYLKLVKSEPRPDPSHALISAADLIDEKYLEDRRTRRWELLSDKQRKHKSFQVKNNAKELGALISFWMKCGNIQYWKRLNI